MKIFTEEQRRGLIVAVPLLLIVLLLSVLVERRVDPMLLTPQERIKNTRKNIQKY